MTKYVPYEKLSKKKKREIDLNKRKESYTYGIEQKVF